ncbi:hypothetical protein LZ30DRAFT_334364 [Colletotrichum cereale]|nr:hypothetical protein LZ30DRAFT_334364 [Colletotrichum cereale]
MRGAAQGKERCKGREHSGAKSRIEDPSSTWKGYSEQFTVPGPGLACHLPAFSAIYRFLHRDTPPHLPVFGMLNFLMGWVFIGIPIARGKKLKIEPAKKWRGKGRAREQTSGRSIATQRKVKWEGKMRRTGTTTDPVWSTAHWGFEFASRLPLSSGPWCLQKA